jgi:hypothetical protein
MLTEDEKREMREMAASASLKEDFRTMRRNSRAIEARISVDELIQWLTAMARTCPAPAKRRAVVEYTTVKL